MNEVAPLWSWQKECIERAKNLEYFGIFADPGTGKTRTVIDIVRQKYANHGQLLKTLVLSPQVVMQNWKNEWLKYSKIEVDNIIILKGTGNDRVKLMDKNFNSARIIICNYETLLMAKVFQKFQEYRFECVISDESHRIKNHSSKRTKSLISLTRQTLYKYILTGTPVLQSPTDLFSQFLFLDGGRTFAPCGENFYAFQRQFFYNKNAFSPAHVTWPEWVIRPGSLDEISSRISRVSMHVKKSECLDLPPMIRKTIPIELSSEQKKHYEMMKQNFITFLGDKACTAQLAITKGLRLQQIVSGFIQLEDGAAIQLKDNPRLKALEEILEDLVQSGGHKCIIWACWKVNYEQIKDLLEKMKIKYVEVHGEVSAKKKQEAIDSFCNDESVKIFLGNQGAAGIGINLVQASYAIYYSRNFSLEHDIQSEARNYRGGSNIHEKVTRIDLVAQGTIDTIVLQALHNKQEIGDKLLRDLSHDI